jgi:DNA-binding response OmpR family regulator
MAGDKSLPTILFIDDDEYLAEALSMALTQNGYQVRHAPDGDQGLAMAAAEPPDLILLDLMMPVKNGFEACTELRQIPALRDVPIVAMTAFGQDIGEIHGMDKASAALHIQDFVEKPFEINVLLERIETLMRGS